MCSQPFLEIISEGDFWEKSFTPQGETEREVTNPASALKPIRSSSFANLNPLISVPCAECASETSRSSGCSSWGWRGGVRTSGPRSAVCSSTRFPHPPSVSCWVPLPLCQLLSLTDFLNTIFLFSRFHSGHPTWTPKWSPKKEEVQWTWHFWGYSRIW